MRQIPWLVTLVFAGVSGNGNRGICRFWFSGLLPELPSIALMNQLRLANGYAQAELMPNSDPVSPSFRIRVIVPVSVRQDLRYDGLWSAQQPSEPYWLQITRQVPESITAHMNEVQQGIRDYEVVFIASQSKSFIHHHLNTCACYDGALQRCRCWFGAPCRGLLYKHWPRGHKRPAMVIIGRHQNSSA